VILGIYLVFALRSIKKTVEEIGNLAIYAKSEIPSLKDSAEQVLNKSKVSIERINGVIEGFTSHTSSIKHRIIDPLIIIIGTIVGVKEGINTLFKILSRR
jgi:uncharacterized protein YoxC